MAALLALILAGIAAGKINLPGVTACVAGAVVLFVAATWELPAGVWIVTPLSIGGYLGLTKGAFFRG